MTKLGNCPHSVTAVFVAVVFVGLQPYAYCETPQTRPQSAASFQKISLTYPYSDGKLSFPKDEGKHAFSEFPYTMMEWFAHYSHLTTEDGSRYFLFSTFVTFDPIEGVLGGRFPHFIATLIDVDNAKTYLHHNNAKLVKFAQEHADAETSNGDYFRWKGENVPFQYEYHVAVRNSQIKYTVNLDLEMLKPPLIVNKMGYIKQPKGISGYYSQTRLGVTGSVTINGDKKQVTGIHWVDRQWLGASFALNNHYTYQWWALQLDNNEEAIMFKIWDTNNDTVAMTVLEINHADGKREKVGKFSLENLPLGWRLSAPQAGWDLSIIPACKDQGTWQCCDVTGTINKTPVTGVAVAELLRKKGAELFQASGAE